MDTDHADTSNEIKQSSESDEDSQNNLNVIRSGDHFTKIVGYP